MSKSITITLPNNVADSLDSHMEKMNEQLPPGARRSKSDYVATSVKAQLEKDGVVIPVVVKSAKPAIPIPPPSGQEPL